MSQATQGKLTPNNRAALHGNALIVRHDPESEAAIAEARAHTAAKGNNFEFTLRDSQRGDDNYILDNWTRSYLFSDVARPIPRDVYNVEQRARIARIMNYAKVMCAVDKKDKTRIKGWICFQAAVSSNHWVTVHYLCVHPSLQNNGIGRALINVARLLSNKPEDPLWITHWTLPMRRLVDRWNLIYNPFLLEVLHVYN